MQNNKKAPVTFDSVAISVASPEDILAWSHGEVKKPETINYRTQKPEKDGLFCERIFGPTKNWECCCGKYKRVRYKGVVCEKCGVEVTRSIVRRERMAHIKLAVPVTHIWFLRSTPSRIGLLLDLPVKTLEQVVYFAAYIVTNVDAKAREEAQEQLKDEFQNYKKNLTKEHKEKTKEIEKNKGIPEKEKEKLLSEIEKESALKIEELVEQHQKAKDDLSALKTGTVLSEIQYRDISMKFGHIFKAGTGAEALREIIKNMNLEELRDQLEIDCVKATGQKKKKLIKRIKLIGSSLKAGIKPEWMIMKILPVIPPDLRPMVQLDGGRFAASDLNDLYRRVINRNNRLKKLIAIGAPEVITRNEKRMMQEAVDTLLNNSARQNRTVFNTGDKRKLRSLSDMLKGKQGRFRQNLLGKRVDYSGRSVIVVGPKLKLNQCGLPKAMALELFKPFVIGKLIKNGYAHNIKNAEKLITLGKKEVWDILEEVTQGHYVLLNRAPTLHRLGIQAFQPVLVEGKAIQIHPLVCAAFNADFDGDQMAVHIPLSKRAQEEAKKLMASTSNLLKPSAGMPIITASQDMVLGCYYLTQVHDKKKGEGMIFSDEKEAILAHELGNIHLQAKIKVRINGELTETSVGRVLFNQILPEELRYKNNVMKKNDLKNLITESIEKTDSETSVKLSDAIKKIGFTYATLSGLSIAGSDMEVPAEKAEIVEKATEIVKNINNQYWKGLVTDDERYTQTIKIWSRAKSDLATFMIKNFSPENDILYMIDSGARGNWGQVTQLCGMKGLVANPAGRTIELPIKSNLKEGFTILEYFIATHGGRKGKSDTALKTAEAGYLTRRLVDAVQDVVIKEDDCGNNHSHYITAEESEKIGEAFEHRIFGRTLAENLVDPQTGEILIKKGTQLENSQVRDIMNKDIDTVAVRSIMTCQTEGGICQKCYGKDLGTNKTVQRGTAVGIIAAQSIGEPGTQLTMRTFHMGGVADESDITQGLTRVEELFEARPPKAPAILSELNGKAKLRQGTSSNKITILSDNPIEETYHLAKGHEIKVKVGDKVKVDDILAKGKTKKQIINVETKGTVKKITKNTIVVLTDESVEKVYEIPLNRTLKVKTGDLVAVGSPLTAGHSNLRELLKMADRYAVQKYIMTEVQSIYASQGQTINDKHIEIIVRQMFSKARIVNSGDTKYLPGEVADAIGIEKANTEAKKEGKEAAETERLLLGLTRISLHTPSWLSAASFQETIRVLVEAATTKRVDELKGLKENVIIGKLIPAGEVYRRRAGIAEQE
ncbi:MAG: DNA-directed RNA polymerase subunit beta' [Patescibacteria group bacterium]|nr:DNA-directed RNA polymerase subunit beta' [Patescibacteria group bacterium]